MALQARVSGGYKFPRNADIQNVFKRDATIDGADAYATDYHEIFRSIPTEARENAELIVSPMVARTATTPRIHYLKMVDGRPYSLYAAWTRGGTISGTYFTKDNELLQAYSGAPRFDYVDGVAHGILVEGSSTNLAIQSDDETAFETGTNITAHPNDFGKNGAAMGFLNAYAELIAGSIYNEGTVVNGTAYIVSCLVRMADLGEPVVGTNTTDGDFSFKISGTICGTVGHEYVGNNVWRCWGLGVAGASDLTINGIWKHAGQSSRRADFTAFQVEPGVYYPSSYMHTAGLVATRTYDQVIIPITSTDIGTDEGAILIRTNRAYGKGSTGLPILITSGSDTVGFYFTNTVPTFKRTIAAATLTQAGSAASKHNLVISWSAGTMKCYINGVQVHSAAYSGTFNPTSIRLSGDSTDLIRMSIRHICVFNTSKTAGEALLMNLS